METTGECAQSLSEMNRIIVWDVLYFPRIIFGASEADERHSQSRTTVIIVGASRTVIGLNLVCVLWSKQKLEKQWQQSVLRQVRPFCGRCGHLYNWREGSQILSLWHGPEPKDVGSDANRRD